MIKKARKTARGVVGFGLMTGAGSTVLGKIGGSTSTYMQGQLGSGGLAGYAPMGIATGMGMGMMQETRKLRRKKSRR